jgi:hypothetical protein
MIVWGSATCGSQRDIRPLLLLSWHFLDVGSAQHSDVGAADLCDGVAVRGRVRANDRVFGGGCALSKTKTNNGCVFILHFRSRRESAGRRALITHTAHFSHTTAADIALNSRVSQFRCYPNGKTGLLEWQAQYQPWTFRCASNRHSSILQVGRGVLEKTRRATPSALIPPPCPEDFVTEAGYAVDLMAFPSGGRLVLSSTPPAALVVNPPSCQKSTLRRHPKPRVKKGARADGNDPSPHAQTVSFFIFSVFFFIAQKCKYALHGKQKVL